MSSNLASAIFDAPLDLASEVIDVPEWGGVKLKVLEPTAERRAHLAQQFVEAAEDGSGVKLVQLYPSLLIACVVDPETDVPVFTDADAGRINAREGRVVERLAQACMKVSGLDDSGDGPFGDDSSTSPSDAPSTDSPST